MHLQTSCSSEGRDAPLVSVNEVEQGLAEAEEELALSLSRVPLGEVLPPHLPRAELGRSLPGRVSLGIWLLSVRPVWRPRDKLQPRQISAVINRIYIKTNNKPSSNLQVLTLGRRCQGWCDPRRVTRVVYGQAGEGAERWGKLGGKPLCLWPY